MPSKTPDTHAFCTASPADSRSPCPGLNTLANHGYIPRAGRDISPLQLVRALRDVYHLSLPFALFLTLAGMITAGRISLAPPRFTLDLAALATCGPAKLAHAASLVHTDAPPHAPRPALPTRASPALLAALLERGPLTLRALAAARVAREAELSAPLSTYHSQVAQGEAALGWLVLRARDGAIPPARLRQWAVEERLPDGWWDGVRPQAPVSLLQARWAADQVAWDMTAIRMGGAGASLWLMFYAFLLSVQNMVMRLISLDIFQICPHHEVDDDVYAS